MPVSATCLGAVALAFALASDGPGIDLFASHSLDAWKAPVGAWQFVGGVTLDPKDPKKLAAEPGGEAIYNGPAGRTINLFTKESFGDLTLHAEFLIPKGSNSGLKFNGHYEVQILDSWGKSAPKGSDCGGIYPKADLLPHYHYLDDGHPPRLNACRPPGEWQELDVVFLAPRFDAGGVKVRKARFERVVLNGQVVQEGVDLDSPTGHAYSLKEVPSGPLMIQADHGPVAFRNMRVTRLGEAGK